EPARTTSGSRPMTAQRSSRSSARRSATCRMTGRHRRPRPADRGPGDRRFSAMKTHSASGGADAVTAPTRPYGLSLSERPALPDADAEGIDEDLIRDVVAEFYRRARRDGRLGPVFEAQVNEWDAHLARMNDFWSAALLRTGRYSGRPVETHRRIGGLSARHF